MDFTNELLAELQGGKSVEDLAKELTKAINTASQENERIKAEEEARRKADMKAQDKHNAVLAVLDAVIDMCLAWDICPEVVKELREMDEDEVDEIVQEIEVLIPTLKLYGEIISQVREARPEPDTAPAEDPIESFLDKFVG